jgi:hypothetical protein
MPIQVLGHDSIKKARVIDDSRMSGAEQYLYTLSSPRSFGLVHGLAIILGKLYIAPWSCRTWTCLDKRKIKALFD